MMDAPLGHGVPRTGMDEPMYPILGRGVRDDLGELAGLVQHASGPADADGGHGQAEHSMNRGS